MSVWKRFDTYGFPSQVTTNVKDRRPIFSSPQAAKMLFEVLREVRLETDILLLGFVIMPDHIHLVIRLPASLLLSRVMQLIKGRFSNRYHKAAGTRGQLWQERYHEETLRSHEQLIASLEYVHANPVKASLVTHAEEFEWSSANCRWNTDLRLFLEGDADVI